MYLLHAPVSKYIRNGLVRLAREHGGVVSGASAAGAASSLSCQPLEPDEDSMAIGGKKNLPRRDFYIIDKAQQVSLSRE